MRRRSRDRMTKWGLRRQVVHQEDEINTLEAQIEELKRARDHLERLFIDQRGLYQEAMEDLRRLRAPG